MNEDEEYIRIGLAKTDMKVHSVPSADRKNQVSINNEIALHATRKNLDAAMVLFNTAIEQGLANSHTYAAALNANIRCGSLDGAEKVLTEMSANGRKKDVVICTTLIKGYCGGGQLNKALMLLEDMDNSKPAIVPNIRTLNTILRGCVQAGDITNADIVLNKAIKVYKISLDVSSWEYMVILFCQGLRIDKVLPILGRLKADAAMRSGIANMNVNLARAAALCGEWKTCRKALAAALAALDYITTETTQTQATSEVSAVEKKTVTGGKRAWKSGSGDGSNEVNDEHDQRRLQSLELFQQHSREELRIEIGLIGDFVTRMQLSSNCIQLSSFTYLYPYFLRLFSFSSDAKSSASTIGDGNSSRDVILETTLGNLDVVFGLGEFAKRLTNMSFNQLITSTSTSTSKQHVGAEQVQSKKKPKTTTPSAIESVASAEVQQIMRGLREGLSQRIDSEGRLNFDQMFCKSVSNATDSPAAVKRKLLKMEICSGAGEWAVAQAMSDVESNWVTLELRHDRVYQTFTRAVIGGVDNLCVLGGDAMNILPLRVKSDTVDYLFVNHPEPPQQHGGIESQGKHLLTAEFFVEASRILNSKMGTFTIVTDNLWYGKFLMRLIAGLQSRGDGTFQLRSLSIGDCDKSDDWQVLDSDGRVNLFMGRPGRTGGHMVDASSYFDRLWKRGKLAERYFIVLKKDREAVNTSNPAAKLASLLSECSQENKKRSSQSKIAKSQGNTKHRQSFSNKKNNTNKK